MIDDRDFRREAQKRGDNPWIRLVAGLGILAFGIIAWLDRIGRIEGSDYLRWWAVIMIAFGVAHLINKQWIGAAVWFVLGLAFMPPLPFLPAFRFSYLLDLWPLLISAAGVTLIIQAIRPAAKDAVNGGSFRAFAWMGGSSRRVSTEDFVGGDAVVVMGACEVNLANSKIVSEAVIDVLAFWGGIEIRVPKDWIIESHVVPLLAGFSNRTTNPTSGDGPRLIIRGSAIMGGIEIRNPKEVVA
jgi:hypothetical protein